MEQKIQDEINNLNKDKAMIEEDKEKIRNIYLEIEKQDVDLNNDYKSYQRENIGIELRTKIIENMRFNNILNNKYSEDINNNYEVKGNNTAQNFGKNDFKLDESKNFSNTNSIFNKGGKRLNAEEYFKNLSDSLNSKRNKNIDMNEDMNAYLMNGKNYVKDMREKLKGLENGNE
jgi:hypothetical protein